MNREGRWFDSNQAHQFFLRSFILPDEILRPDKVGAHLL